MSATPSTARLGRLCKRYGPGRLPRADHPAIGAGYAMATAALLAAVLFTTVAAAYAAFEVGPTSQLFGTMPLVPYALTAIPIVVPTAFLAGVVTWHVLPGGLTYHGPVGGLAAMLLTYVVATLVVSGSALAYYVVRPATFFGPDNAVGVGLIFGFFGFLYTCWITLPLGTLTGYVHDRAVTTE